MAGQFTDWWFDRFLCVADPSDGCGMAIKKIHCSLILSQCSNIYHSYIEKSPTDQ